VCLTTVRIQNWCRLEWWKHQISVNAELTGSDVRRVSGVARNSQRWSMMPRIWKQGLVSRNQGEQMCREKVIICMREINAILRSCKVFGKFNPSWVPSWKLTQTCLVQLWLHGLWLQMPWNSPWLCVQNCHKKGKGCYQVDIDIPGALVYCLF